MSITFTKIFWNDLFAFQKEALKNYLAEQEPDLIRPVDFYTQRKAWESKYDPKFHQKGGIIEVKKVPDISTLPDKKWVLPSKPEDDEVVSRREHRKAMMAWLRTQKFKYQICLVTINRREEEVFLFKKMNNAMMFKLAWG